MQVMSNGRVRRSQAEWVEVLSRCSSSGLSPEAFCQREQIHLGSFLRWQRKLEAAGAIPDFVAVSAAAPARAAWSLEINLPNGCQLRLQG